MIYNDIEMGLYIGLGFSFALGMLFMLLMSKKNFFGFMIFFTIFLSFFVWAGILELYVLVLSLIITFVLFYIKIKRRA